MDISSMHHISALTDVTSDYIKDAIVKSQNLDQQDQSFGTILNSAMDMLNETNDLQNQAESAEIQFALGKTTNTHDLKIAQEKANIALQYTVAVRDKFIEAYREIMNMQV